MALSESVEMYLETILLLQKKLENVRSIDIVNETGFSKPTISEQMRRFYDKGYIHIDNHGYITLSEIGLEIAEKTFEKHKALTVFLKLLGVDDETAANDACRIEHYISDISFEKIKDFIKERENAD